MDIKRKYFVKWIYHYNIPPAMLTADEHVSIFESVNLLTVIYFIGAF